MKRLAVSVLIALGPTISSANDDVCGIKYAPGRIAQDGRQEFAGTYRNLEYGYSVVIPSGLLGRAGNEPLLPNHGFTIVLSDHPLAYIYVTARYEVIDTGTSAALERRKLADMKKTAGVRVLRVQRFPVRLGSISARRHLASISCKGHSGVYVRDETLAVANGTEYTLGLLTPEERYERDAAVLAKILSSWAWIQR